MFFCLPRLVAFFSEEIDINVYLRCLAKWKSKECRREQKMIADCNGKRKKKGWSWVALVEKATTEASKAESR